MYDNIIYMRWVEMKNLKADLGEDITLDWEDQRSEVEYIKEYTLVSLDPAEL